MIQENPLYGLVFGKPFLLYHRFVDSISTTALSRISANGRHGPLLWPGDSAQVQGGYGGRGSREHFSGAKGSSSKPPEFLGVALGKKRVGPVQLA